jgi:hypothetical protein
MTSRIAFASIVLFSQVSVFAQSDGLAIPKAPPSVDLNDLAIVQLFEESGTKNLRVRKINFKTTTSLRTVPDTTQIVEQRTRKVKVNGEEVEQTYTVLVPVTTMKDVMEISHEPSEETSHEKLDEMQVYNLLGRIVDQDEWKTAFAKPKRVFIVYKPVDAKFKLEPFYIGVLRPDTLFVCLPEKKDSEVENADATNDDKP